MRNRDNRYRLRTKTGNHTLSRLRWTRIVAAGLAVVLSDHLAEARRGVLVELRAGELWVCDPTWLYTSWISIDRMAPIRGEHWQKEVERDHCLPKGVRVEPYTETRTRMIGWGGTVGELQTHVEQMRKAA
jgi:hypothetical protein